MSHKVLAFANISPVGAGVLIGASAFSLAVSCRAGRTGQGYRSHGHDTTRSRSPALHLLPSVSSRGLSCSRVVHSGSFRCP
jgi:hypothetical protein